MAKVQGLEAWRESANAKLDLKGGGGDGTFDDMEKRIESLESGVRDLNKTALQIAMDTSYLKGRVEDAPTKDWINSRMLAIVGGSTALIAILIGILGLALN